MSIGAVVLNYVDYASTLRCVKSLLACDPRPERIVVVDNASPNESCATLRAALQADGVELVQSDRNGGYSYGNNVGIRWLRARGIEHVVLATSDAVVRTPTIFARLAEVADAGAGLAGPRISDPTAAAIPLRKITFKYCADMAWVQLGMPLATLRRRIRSVVALLRHEQCPAATSSIESVYRLHGSFICLSDAYLTRHPELNERLFMFLEEDVLAWNCRRAGLAAVYLSDVEVDHGGHLSIRRVHAERAGWFIESELRRSGIALRDIVPLRALVRLWLSAEHGSPVVAGGRTSW